MSAVGFFDTMMQNMINDLHICLIGRIEKIDLVSMKADVQPFFYNTANTEPMPLLLDVPVALQRAGGFFIRMPYKKGDLVVVVFAQRDIDEVAETGELKKHTSERQHDLSDAIVVSGFNPFSHVLPAEYIEDMLIATEDMAAKFIITKDKKIIIEAENGVEIKGKSSSGNW